MSTYSFSGNLSKINIKTIRLFALDFYARFGQQSRQLDGKLHPII